MSWRCRISSTYSYRTRYTNHTPATNSQRTGPNEAPLANQRSWGGARSGGGPPPSSSYGGGGGGGGGYDDRGSYGGGGGGGARGYGSSNYGLPPSSSSYDSRGSYGGGPPPSHSSGPPPMNMGGPPPGALMAPGGAAEPRKRKSRWGDENDRIQVAGLPTAISGGIAGKDLETYAVHVRLEEIGRKLRSGDVVPPERERWVPPIRSSFSLLQA